MLVFILETAQNLPSPVADYLTQGGIVGFLGWLLWQNSKANREAQAKSDARYEELAKDFRQIVQENTASNVALREGLASHSCTVKGMFEALMRETRGTQSRGSSGA
jgi:hypothetical protein